MRLAAPLRLWLIALAMLFVTAPASAAPDPLPSWADGPTKTAVMRFVAATVTQGGPKYVAPEARIATFDQDGTLWVEQPMYSQVIYALDRVPALVKAKPELAGQEPFKTILTGDMAKIARLPMADLETVLAATLTGMTTDQFQTEVSRWISARKDRRWNRLYTQLTYAPMQDMMKYLRANGYRTYIVTGGFTPGMGLLVLHDDAAREYAYGPATGLPDSKVGTFPQALYDEAKAKGWTIISMKNDWKRVFAGD